MTKIKLLCAELMIVKIKNLAIQKRGKDKEVELATHLITVVFV